MYEEIISNFKEISNKICLFKLSANTILFENNLTNSGKKLLYASICLKLSLILILFLIMICKDIGYRYKLRLQHTVNII